MSEHRLTQEQIPAFGHWLRREERSPGTIEEYRRDVWSFAVWLDGRPVTKERAAAWKEHLAAEGYAPAMVNSMLAVVNFSLRFAGWEDCRVRLLKVQRRMFRNSSRELDRADYGRLVAAARTLCREPLALLMETICATGIRVSEVRYITVEALRAGRAEIALKSKIRTILLPGKLCRKLLKYARQKKIASGEVFLTKGGKGLSRKQIWAEMKRLCRHAGVDASKVFPHNLRHLFATTFYRVSRDIAKLADVLGHSSMETTRIYLLTSGADHQRQLERLVP